MPRDLGPDVSQRVDVATRLLVPDGPAPEGYRLTVTGQEPFDYAWRQPEEKQVREGNGDPNGNVTAPKGTLYVERDAPALWQNTDGLTAWVQVGGAGGTNYWQFDGTLLDLDPTNTSGIDDFDVTVPGSINIETTGGTTNLGIDAGGDGSFATTTALTLFAGTDMTLSDQGSPGIVLNSAMRVRLNGAFLRAFPEPADANLGDSEFVLWLDDTPGTTVLNIKAKDSAGTVRTGSVALT